MPLAAVAVTLLAALLHALWNRRVHVTDDRVPVMVVAAATASVALLPFVALDPPVEVLPVVVLSGLLQAVYSVLLTAAYARGSLAVTYPVGRGTAPLLVTLGAWLLLGQQPVPLAILGAVLLGAGLTTVALVGHRAGQGAAVGLAVLVGVSIAAYSVIDAGAVARTSPLGFLGAVSVVQTVVLLVGTALVRRGAAAAALLTALRSGVLVGLGMSASYGLVLIAFRWAPAGRVATLRETSVLIAVALAGGVRTRATWVGAGLVVAGALAAAW